MRENYQAHEFVQDEFGWKKLRKLANKFTVINEKNDPNVSLDLGKEVAKNLDAELVMTDTENHMHHFDLDIINRRL